MPVDKTNKTNCAILYLDGIANPSVIKEVKRRLTNLNLDFISGSGMLEELISDVPPMPFPHITTTERPDRAASSIMDGKVILVIEGAPFVSSVPSSFFETLQSPEDYSLKWQFATFLRYLRLIAMFATLLLPGLYVAITLYHHEMIPTELLNSIVKSRENVPFPTMVEITLLEISFKLIREGGIRMPGALGNTLGIVGALILGQAAAQAQLVSPILIIIVAVVGICSFAASSHSMDFTFRLLRFVVIFFAAIAGFYWVSIALVIILGILCGVKSFGVPYLAPVAPATKANPDVIALLMLSIAAIRAREFAEVLKVYVLPLTPMTFILILFIGTTVILNILGLETIARFSRFIIYIIVVGFFIVLVLGQQSYSIHHLFPILGYGIGKTILHGLIRSSVC